MFPQMRRMATIVFSGGVFLALASGAGAQPSGDAEMLYQSFKQRYQDAGTAADLHEALRLIQQANELEPTRYKFAYGAGATYLRLEEFKPCVSWFGHAIVRAEQVTQREAALAQRDLCQSELDRLSVQGRPAALTINFSTKEADVSRSTGGPGGDLNTTRFPSVFPGALEREPAALVAEIRNRLPARSSVSIYRQFVVASPDQADETQRHGKRMLEYDQQIRRRFFPNTPKRRLILLLSTDSSALRQVARDLYAGVRFSRAPFFGIYVRQDRLIVASVRGGYGTALHELMHALIEDDFPNAPLWLEEGMATLYERSGWSAERLLPYPNWRMKLTSSRRVLADDAFDRVDNDNRVTRHELALIRLLFSYLDDRGELAGFYQRVKRLGPNTTLSQALEGSNLDRNAWRDYVDRSFRQYKIETRSSGTINGMSSRREVKYVQRVLNVVMDSALKPDGIWGKSSRRALKAFQRRFDLEADGVVGRQTRAALQREFEKKALE